MPWPKALKRIELDVKKLREAGFPAIPDEGPADAEIDLKCFQTTVTGPKDSPYEGGVWRVRFTFVEDYPFKSPSVGFVDKILHPNVDEASGSICLDSLNKEWQPTFNVLHIVESQLPYLMTYPNPDDPFNSSAANQLKRDKKAFEGNVRRHARIHAFKHTERAAASSASVEALPAPSAAGGGGGGGGGSNA